MTEQDRTGERVDALRKQVGELREAQHKQRGHAAFAGLAGALAVAAVVLTTGTWFESKSVRYNAWQQPDDVNWFGYVAVVLLLVAAVLSVVGVRLDRYKFHWLVAWVAGLAGVCVMALVAQLPREQAPYTAPAFWFTVVAAFGLAAVHGYRGDELRHEFHD